mgnify:CR=1 FL=1
MIFREKEEEEGELHKEKVKPGQNMTTDLLTPKEMPTKDTSGNSEWVRNGWNH